MPQKTRKTTTKKPAAMSKVRIRDLKPSKANIKGGYPKGESKDDKHRDPVEVKITY
jgi:hypothetical protein